MPHLVQKIGFKFKPSKFVPVGIQILRFSIGCRQNSAVCDGKIVGRWEWILKDSTEELQKAAGLSSHGCSGIGSERGEHGTNALCEPFGFGQNTGCMLEKY